MTARADGRKLPHLRLSRRHVLAALPLLLAACYEPSPPHPDFTPLSFDYLSKLKLLVATIDIDNEFAKQDTAETQHVEQLSPTQPQDALTRMAQDRLIPAGNNGHAVFTIIDASIVRVPGGFEGSMHVRLDITTSDGAKSGFTEAKASRTYHPADTSDDATRAALYELTKLMMSDINVELEYQVKQKLRDYLQTGDETAPPPPPVQTQDLNTGTPMPGSDPGPPPAAPAQ